MKPLLFLPDFCVSLHLLVCTQGSMPLLGVSLVHVLGWEVSVCTYSAPTCVAICMHISMCAGAMSTCVHSIVVCPPCGVLSLRAIYK